MVSKQECVEGMTLTLVNAVHVTNLTYKIHTEADVSPKKAGDDRDEDYKNLCVSQLQTK